MRKSAFALFSFAILSGVWLNMNVAARADNDGDDNSNNKIAVLDSCDPSDPGWAPTGGCFFKNGQVSFAEFNALLFSPLGGGPAGGILIGHPAWRNQPSFITIREGKSIHVENKGGRTHSFTKVASFGGGIVPPLNGGLAAAPECAAMVPLPAGNKIAVSGLADGTHHFQCCIHPWMRATVHVN
jgi:plastocyanin